MDEVPSINTLRAGASALISAAELLAKLAATISETAQTLSTAVELLSNTAPKFKLPQDSAPADINRHSERVSDQTSPSSPTQDSLVTTTKPRQPYHILVENEADVLLFACVLIHNCKSVVCYMGCDVSSLRIYKKFIKTLTHTQVEIFNGAKPSTLNIVSQHWVNNRQAALLVSETDIPDIAFHGEDTWVLHVGWPYDQQRYEAQKATHKAQNNILIACSEGRTLYSSSATIMEHCEPWVPCDAESLRTTIEALLPLFDEQLTKVPLKKKKKIYRSWIRFHGPHGPRYISTWTTSTLVRQANLYILDALKYGGPGSDSSRSVVQVALPKVSAEFVTQNGLQSAVEGGVLRMEFSDSDLSPTASQNGDDPALASLNEGENVQIADSVHDEHMALDDAMTLDLGNQDSAIHHSDNQGVPSESSNEPCGIPNDSARLESSQQPAQYFAIEDEFDAIPLICYMINEHEKSICFLDEPRSLKYYRRLLKEITGDSVVIISPKSTYDEATCKQAVFRFRECKTCAVLLLAYTTKTLMTTLKGVSIGSCIYWRYYPTLRSAEKHRSELACQSMCTIMTTTQRDGILAMPRPISLREHPSASALRDVSKNSLLWPMRDATQSALASNEDIVKGLYRARLYFFAKVSRSLISAEEVARRANDYAAKVLLHGEADCDEERGNFAPLGGRPLVSQKIVEGFSLQPAVKAGLISVG